MTAATLPGVRVVVLNWNGAALTAACVRSLLATDYPADRFEIVVVDNGSIDGSVPVLRRSFGSNPQVRLLENGANLGFAEGCNRAMRDLDDGSVGPVDAVALVNNDATVEPGWLRAMTARMFADDSIGAVAPKMLLADRFVTVGIDYEPVAGERSRIVSVTVGGRESLDRVIPGDGVVSPPDPSVPLGLHREVAAHGELHVPVGLAGRIPEIVVHVDAPGAVHAAPATGGVAHESRTGTASTLTWTDPGPPARRINSLGTATTEWCEGVERRFGEADLGDPVSEEVPGWSGGGVLLRREYLEQVGLFDPTFFAYYEDTDLSWRGRRAGWRTVTEPAAVIHHLHGATAGNAWAGFFFLNYRNWLLTVLRNGSGAEIRAAFRAAWGNSWPFVRRNLTGRLRRLQRPDTRIASRWAHVAAGVLAAAPRVGASRRAIRSGPGSGGHRSAAPIGSVRQDVDPSTRRHLGDPAPRPPRPRAGGPTLVYVDVTETLQAGWRAGIQRVVTRLVQELLADPAVELVPVVWSPLDGAWRRLTRTETERLLDPPPMRNHPPAPLPPAPAWRRLVGPVTRIGPLRTAKESVRRARERRDRDPAIGRLVLERFEPGAVFFDPDASWNLTDVARSSLLPELALGGVASVAFVHDVMPITNPEWFDPNLARVFAAHVDAHLRHGSSFVVNSHHTAEELRKVAAAAGVDPGAIAVAPLGADHAAVPTSGADHRVRDELAADIAARPTAMVVGTIEPRKNHALLLDALDRMLAAGEDVGLVVVGRLGWRADHLGERLRHHPEFGRRVRWPESVGDDELEALYGAVAAVVVPSLSEGFGLPVAEALGRGCAVVSSTGGALAELGGDAVERFDPTDLEALVAALRSVLGDPSHAGELRTRAAAWTAPSWAECARVVSSALRAATPITRRS